MTLKCCKCPEPSCADFFTKERKLQGEEGADCRCLIRNEGVKKSRLIVEEREEKGEGEGEGEGDEEEEEEQ